MSLAFQSNDPIKEAIYAELLNLLSPDRETRVSAEERMKQLEITEGYGVYLAELVMNQSFDVALRQLASVMLNKYVEKHWNVSNSDVTILATDLAKKMIRSILPNGLYDSNSKIRTSVAYTISIIASLDWPNTWTELFDIIVKCLSENNENSIHGAMQVLVEFTDDLDSQIKVVGPIIMSEVYRIFEAEQVYNVKTRTCAVKIFKSLFKSINVYVTVKEEQDKMLNPILPGLIEKLTNALTNPNQSSFVLKTETIKVLQYLVNEMPRYIRPFTAQILPPIWQLLTQTADIYVKVIVNSSEACPLNDNDDDDDDEISNFTTMILQLIEFIQSMVEQNRFKSAIKNVLSDLIYIMIVYMQITEDQIESWTEDSTKFVEDESHGEIDDSVRTSSLDVLENLAPKFGDKLFPALTEALERHVNVAEAEKNAQSPHWWKIHEASMVAVGNFRDVILDKPDKFDIAQYLNYVRNSMVHQVSPYLMARCVWLLSRFVTCNVYNAAMLEELLETILNSLQSDKALNLRIYAVRSIHEICDSLKDCKDERHNLVASKLGGFLDGILALVPLIKNPVLSLLLEVITTLTSFDINFAAAHSNKIIPLTVAVFLKHKDYPFLLDHVQDLLKILSQNPYCLQPLQEKIVPTIVSILNIQGDSSINPMQETALDVLQTVVKYSKAPLSEQLIENAFPAAVHCILRTDDNSVMQSGGECLREFISVSPEQVCTYKNGQGLNYIMEITTMLLNPMNTEYSASFAGRLVITFITKAGNMLGENIFLLLKAVISKMQLVESLNVAMSLIMTFAHLFVTQMEAVLNFLSTVPGPTGEPAIQFVFSNWLSRQNLFYGSYERKVSTMALCKLFEHGVTTQDSRLTSVTVRDQIETDPSAVQQRSTRSQTAAANNTIQWTTIPVLVKIFKLLINELAYLKESNLDDNDSDSESGNNSNNDVEDDTSTSECQDIKRPWNFDDDDDEDDENSQLMEELMKDPIFQTNMEDTLTKFLQNFSREEYFREFTSHLNQMEKHTLQSIQVTV